MQSYPNRKSLVVYRGRHLGFYSTWEECEEEMENFPRALHRVFSTKEEAESDWMRYWSKLPTYIAEVRVDLGLPVPHGNLNGPLECTMHGNVADSFPMIPKEENENSPEDWSEEEKREGHLLLSLLFVFLLGVFVVIFFTSLFNP
ncbi:Ribosomal protein L9/RNase H1, N-terminal [Sesbania bispinosa]|nr:Ribosomal protein L9/RNase H1, N-terminal [Sesbania bispinosa]